jgi:hypothetical protein
MKDNAETTMGELEVSANRNRARYLNSEQL